VTTIFRKTQKHQKAEKEMKQKTIANGRRGATICEKPNEHENGFVTTTRRLQRAGAEITEVASISCNVFGTFWGQLATD